MQIIFAKISIGIAAIGVATPVLASTYLPFPEQRTNFKSFQACKAAIKKHMDDDRAYVTGWIDQDSGNKIRRGLADVSTNEANRSMTYASTRTTQIFGKNASNGPPKYQYNNVRTTYTRTCKGKTLTQSGYEINTLPSYSDDPPEDLETK